MGLGLCRLRRGRNLKDPIVIKLQASPWSCHPEQARSRRICSYYCTTSVSATVLVNPALVPATEIAYVPPGVVTPLPPPPPPGPVYGGGISRPDPHPAISISPNNTHPLQRYPRRRPHHPTPNRTTAHQTVFELPRSSPVAETPVSTVSVITVDVPRAGVPGVTVQTEFAGIPLHTNVAVPGVPAAELKSNAYVADSPLLTVAELGPSGASAKSTPTPASATNCGEPAALSANDTLPTRVPPTVGANATCTVQLPPAATVASHVIPTAGSVKSPFIVIPEIANGAPPIFDNVSICGAEFCPTPSAANVSDPGVIDTPGPAIPVPRQRHGLRSELVRHG